MLMLRLSDPDSALCPRASPRQLFKSEIPTVRIHDVRILVSNTHIVRYKL